MRIGGDNCTQWINNNTVFYVHKVVIKNGELTEFKMSFGQKLKALLGIGPNYDESKKIAEVKFREMGLLNKSKEEPRDGI